ncbi:NAD-dependent epimerase/dehydratase family protein [Streptomyces phytohabitans]|uniref:NAD-dependent epimerase/dehydratase family protein n=1 Tax=Streptomyces phytohabitans TaxID=1150371 RepID=UPI00345BC0D5
MRIVGNGFVASHLREAFDGRFPRVTAIAAGVSSTSTAVAEEFDREAHLLYEVLRECRRERRTVVFFSTASFAMYGAPESPAAETDPVFPPSVYGRHKLALESCVRSSGADHLILRLSHLIGPRQRAHQLLPALVRQVESGEVTVYDGVYRDLVDIRDLLHALDRLLTDEVSGETLNVVSGRPESVEDVIDGIEKRLGTAVERTRVPEHGGPFRTPVSTARLRKLVPDFDAGSGPPGAYLDRVLDAYVPLYATGATGATGTTGPRGTYPAGG